MWICLNKAFFSIVAISDKDKRLAGKDSDKKLLVRARRMGDIEKVFPGAKVHRLDHRDYIARAFIERTEVAKAFANELLNIDYENFKGSTEDHDLHMAYMKVWSAMMDMQQDLEPSSGYGGTGAYRFGGGRGGPRGGKRYYADEQNGLFQDDEDTYEWEDINQFLLREENRRRR